MRVLMFGWEFPPHITGGLGTACYGMTKGLFKHDIDVIFVVPKAYGDEDEQAIRLVGAGDIPIDQNDVEFQSYWDKIKYIEIGSNIIPYISPEAYEKISETNKKINLAEVSNVFSSKFNFSGSYGTNLMEEVARYALIASALAVREDYDLIHAHDWLTYPAGMAAKYASGKPLVVHMHATEFDRSGENVNQQVYDIERKGMEEADRVITVSNMTRKIVIEKYGINPDKVFTVHNAVDHASMGGRLDIKKNVNEKLVTFLGRLTFQKGPEYFVEAARKLLEKDDNIRFVMAGSGDMMDGIIRHVARLKIADKFHFTGFLKGKDIQRVFSISDVFVMPSVSEPFGIVPLEAMQSEVPVVISKQSGVAEILKHAVKVDYWDVDAMADAIYGLCHYNSLSSMFKQYGKDEVESLKWEDAAVKIKKVYSDML